MESTQTSQPKTQGAPAASRPPMRRPGAGGASRGPRPGGDRSSGGDRGDRRGGPRGDKAPRSEFDQKIVSMRRVTRVVAGGRRFSFSVALAAGDKKGRVGIGVGKAGDTALAIDKALRDAKKHMIRVPLTKTGSIPHEVSTKYSSARIWITPAAGRGMVAGSAVRTVLELAGVKDVVAKVLSPSKNHLNQAKATIDALSQLISR